MVNWISRAVLLFQLRMITIELTLSKDDIDACVKFFGSVLSCGIDVKKFDSQGVMEVEIRNDQLSLYLFRSETGDSLTKSLFCGVVLPCDNPIEWRDRIIAHGWDAFSDWPVGLPGRTECNVCPGFYVAFESS